MSFRFGVWVGYSAKYYNEKIYKLDHAAQAFNHL